MKWLTIPIVLVIAVATLAQDVTTYEGDGFTFDYPSEWVEIDLEDAFEGEVALSPDSNAALEGGVPNALIVQVTDIEDFAESMNSGDGMTFTVEGDVSVQNFTSFAGGVFFLIDGFTGGFSGVEGDVSISMIESDGRLTLIIEGLVTDYVMTTIESEDSFIYVTAQAPAGTLSEWRNEVDVFVESFEIG